jgi:hypothetical protein
MDIGTRFGYVYRRHLDCVRLYIGHLLFFRGGGCSWAVYYCIQGVTDKPVTVCVCPRDRQTGLQRDISEYNSSA